MKVIISALLALSPLLLVEADEAVTRFYQTATVFSAVMATPDRGISQNLLNKAYCIVIVPDLRTMAIPLGGK